MAHDFRNKSFQKVLRGYAPEEVDDYIAYLKEEYRKLERRTTDSERKLSLALKKLDENLKNGAVEATAGPAARDAASRLLSEAETKRAEILAMAEKQANVSAEHIIRSAEEQAATVLNEAVGQAEALLAEAKAQAETLLEEAKAEVQAHQNDVKTMYDTARGMYEEIGAFREKLFGLYNEHLDAIDGISASAEDFMNGMNGQCPESAAESDEEDKDDVPVTAEEDAETEAEEIADEEAAEELLSEETDWDPAEETAEPEDEEAPAEPEEDPVLIDEVASNLAFMDRLFASAEKVAAGEDLYIDLADESEDFEEAEEVGEEETYGEESAEEAYTEEFAEEELPEELPAITIDWKNRSAAAVEEEDETVPDESADFRPADGFEDYGEFDEDYEEDFDGQDGEENYDDYGPAAEEDFEGEEPAEEELPDDTDEDEEEDEGYRAMDALFREDKSKREMSLTDEFNIIFADSKSSANVKEIRRQPTVSPETPKNPKKHKNF